MAEFSQREEKVVGTCDCCGFKDIYVLDYSRAPHLVSAGGIERWMLCDICANTMVTRAVEYSHYGSDTEVLARSIAWIGNAILRAIEEKNDA